jgi:hypothetical protein
MTQPDIFPDADALIESLVTPPQINMLKNQYGLSAIAIESLGAYVMGAQTPAMQFALREGLPAPVERATVADPIDPENTSEASWRKGIHELREHWRRRGIDATDEHRQGAYIASLYLVHERLFCITTSVQPVVLPLIYKREFPQLFGNVDAVTLEDR